MRHRSWQTRPASSAPGAQRAHREEDRDFRRRAAATSPISSASPDNYLSGNPDFCKSALARYTPWHFIELVETHRIPYHEKKLGQQFCDTSSREIINLLLAEAARAKVDIRLNCRVHEVTKTERFRVETSEGTFESQSLVIATGGLSFPKLGATDFGHRTARQFGMKTTALRPGLVPLTLERARAGAIRRT